MGGFIGLTLAARHGSSVNNVVIVASKSSGPELTSSPTPAQQPANVSLAELLLEGSFPQGARDPGELGDTMHVHLSQSLFCNGHVVKV